MNRNEWIESIRNDPDVDVLVVGGGINGIGTFRDLALEGLRVLLVERSDYASGASAASSHMVHGGIRYLENGEFRLVREAVQERNRLLKNAPHLVKPLPTVIPVFKRFSGLLNAPLKFLGWLTRPAERGSIVIKLGLMMYDAYTRGENRVPRHRFESRKQSLDRFPKLNPKIINTATYFDGSMHSPERLALEVLLDGIADSTRAMALNYMSLASFDSSRVELQDELIGQRLSVNPKIIVNAAGPWIDLANRKLGRETDFIGGTKGSHLVLRHDELREAIGESEFFFENTDGRITLIFPLQDCVLIGTSDLPIDDPDDAVCTEEEVDYFLEMLKVVFPAIRVDRSQIVYRFSGVRPLPSSGAATAGQISRDHSIGVIEGKPPILSLIGGKWTTFRAFSEKVADEVLNRLGRTRNRSTKDLPIGGGLDYPSNPVAWMEQLESRTGLAAEVIEELFERYGTRAADFATWMTTRGDLNRIGPYFTAELEYIVRNEHVHRLSDLVQRRTSLAMQGQLTDEVRLQLVDMMAAILGWSDEQKNAESAVKSRT